MVQEYYTSGFLSLQAALDAEVLRLPSDKEASFGPLSPIGSQQTWTQWGAAMPTGSYVHNNFYAAVGPMLGLVLCLSLIFPLSMLVRGMVEVCPAAWPASEC